MKTDRPPLDPQKIRYATAMLKMLAHPVRLQIVEMLDREGALSVQTLVQRLEQPQPTISQHLNAMKLRGVLDSRREGAGVLYFVSQPQIRNLLNCIHNCQLTASDLNPILVDEDDG